MHRIKKDSSKDINIISMGEKENILIIIFKYLMKLQKINIYTISSVRNHPEFKKFSLPVRILRKLLYPLTDIIHVQTNSIKKWYLINTNIETSKIVKIGNISEQNDIKGNTYLQSYRKGFQILLIGNKWKQKGFQYVIDYANFLEKKEYSLSQNITFNIFGCSNNKTEEPVFKEITNKNLKPKSIIFHGIKDYQTIFQKKYDLFLLTSLYEGFPNVLIESIEKGILPIILNYNYGMDEIVGENYEYLINNKNIENFNFIFKKALYLNDTEYEQNMIKLKNRLIMYKPEIIIKEWLKIL